MGRDVDTNIESLRVHTAPGEAADLQEMLDDEGVEFIEIGHIDELRVAADPGVLFLSRGLLGMGGALDSLARLPTHIVVVAADDGGRSAATEAGRLFLAAPELAPGDAPLLRALRSAGAHAEMAAANAAMSGSTDAARRRLADVNRVGAALMAERDLGALLGMILTYARQLTWSDAGSLYLVEGGDGADVGDGPGAGKVARAGDASGAEARLHFLRAQNDSIPDLPDPDFTLPISEDSLAGYAAVTGETLVIGDAYDLPAAAPYSFNSGFDEREGYRARSMLVVPMIDHRNRVVGVLQLINRKRDPEATIRDAGDADTHVKPFSREDIELVQSLAGQAAVSIENGQLYESIENLFEGLVTATVTAIDQRDPTTSGHSVRVAAMTCDVARLMNDVDEGPFADVHFTAERLRQLRYAGLLHDVGKIGVREAVLVKERKLPQVMEAHVEARFELIRALLGPDHAEAVDEALAQVREANIPGLLADEAAELLGEIGRRTFVDPRGEERRWLTDAELDYLSIRRGNLDPDERAQIESHVVHSYEFLREIPWTDDLARIARIVRGHHEKLNGAGYPDGVTAEQLSIETRIMTVCDIFDALTATDRPYKKAVPAERAFQILTWEAEEGALDPDIVELFHTSGVWKRVLNVDWREL